MPIESVRAALNRSGIPITNDMIHSVPERGTPEYRRMICEISRQPANEATRLLRDLKRGIV